MKNIAYCIGCACDDNHACLDHERGEPCHWVRVDYEEGLGVCSACKDFAADWDAGHRSMKVIPIERAQKIALASEA